MTSPTRQRRTRSRRRIQDADAAEFIAKARALAQNVGGLDRGAPEPPLTRGDLQMIRKAIREGWDVPHDKRQAIIAQVVEALDSENCRLSTGAALTILEMSKANQLARHAAERAAR